MTESKQAPREFWIKPAYRPEEEDRISFCKVPKKDFEHVIEYSAYEAEKQKADKLQAELDKANEALKVLKDAVESDIECLDIFAGK